MMTPVNRSSRPHAMPAQSPQSEAPNARAASSNPNAFFPQGGQGTLGGLPTRPVRSNSAPALSGNGDFYGTFRSVMTHGVLPQSQMRAQQIAFNPSHDGAARQAHSIEVTRLPGHQPHEAQAQIATAAVTNAHHGALSVALERRAPTRTGSGGSAPLESRPATPQEVLAGMDPATRAGLEQLPNSTRNELLGVLSKNEPRTLTPAGTADAARRMHSTFVVTAQASAGSAHPTAHEQQRTSIAPADMQQVLVPAQHAHTARQAVRDLRAHGNGPLPGIQPVPSSSSLTPQYHEQNGTAVNIQGVSAPAYHRPIAQQAQQHGDTDIHIVKTAGWHQGAAPAATRPRSDSV